MRISNQLPLDAADRSDAISGRIQARNAIVIATRSRWRAVLGGTPRRYGAITQTDARTANHVLGLFTRLLCGLPIPLDDDGLAITRPRRHRDGEGAQRLGPERSKLET